MSSQTDIVRKETFAPLLYVLSYSDFDEAIKLHNDVPQDYLRAFSLLIRLKRSDS